MTDRSVPPTARRTFAWLRQWFVWVPAVVIVSSAAAAGLWALTCQAHPFPAVTLVTHGTEIGGLSVIRIDDDGNVTPSIVDIQSQGEVFKLAVVGGTLYAAIDHHKLAGIMPTGIYEVDLVSGSCTLVAEVDPSAFWGATDTHFVLHYPDGVRFMLPTGSFEDVPCDSADKSRPGVVTTSREAVVFVNDRGKLMRIKAADRSIEELPVAIPAQARLLACTDTHVVIRPFKSGSSVMMALDGSLPDRTLDARYYAACMVDADLVLFEYRDAPPATFLTTLSSGARVSLPTFPYGAVAYAWKGTAK